MRTSASDRVVRWRALRFMLLERLRNMWRIPDGFILILPLAVKRKRFLAELLVFILGIFHNLSLARTAGHAPGSKVPASLSQIDLKARFIAAERVYGKA